jgi:integrase
VRDACPDYFKPVVTFAYYTGWRKEEILSLRWNIVEIEAEEIWLDVGTTKHDEGRVIALDGELLDALKAQEGRRAVKVPGQPTTLLSAHVFHRNGRPLTDIRDVWQAACSAAGLGQMIEVEGKGKKKQKYTGKIFHDFRPACRDMIRAGIHERVAMDISGHKTRSIFDRYHIVNQNDLKEAARKRSRHVQEQEAKAEARKVVAMNRGA